VDTPDPGPPLPGQLPFDDLDDEWADQQRDLSYAGQQADVVNATGA
jgi:hypothetical protein